MIRLRPLSPQMLLGLAALAVAPGAAPAAPAWLWSSSDAGENEALEFRRKFELPSGVESARALFTCDNSATVYLNGEKAIEVTDWARPARADVAQFLRAGDNEITVDARNAGSAAGLIGRIEIRLEDGSATRIESDATWEVREAGGGPDDWKPAVVVAAYGDAPWRDVFDRRAPRRGNNAGRQATQPGDIAVADGFRVELVYQVPRESQGSWVSLAVEPGGALVAGDQYGGFYRVRPAGINGAAESTVEPFELPLEGGAHGLVFAFDSLYVMVNEKPGKGLWRLRDLDGDGSYEDASHLRETPGGGEHGPHSVVAGPDGQSLYFNGGNHTKLPVGMEHSRAARAWGEDHVLPRMWDANGHAKGVLAPGGWIAKTDPDGETVELISYGYRNQFDIAFSPGGELFTFDADMEWDFGTPWYRPTRVCHATSGSEFGWRSGTGKWPDYYEDSLPATVDIGPGSPTGVAFGTGARFPARFQNALFINDWTYGTMYAVHLVPDGASFRATHEEFLSGRPLPLTDVVVNPADGALYFAVGGRRTQSALYRVTYTGDADTAPAPPPAATPEAELRRRLERLHLDGTSAAAIDEAWPHLGHPDRFVRFAARVAVEHQDPDRWRTRALAETAPRAAAQAMIALARVGEPSDQTAVFGHLAGLPFTALDKQDQLAVVRAYQLAITRLGTPADGLRSRALHTLDALFPTGTNEVDLELCQLLVALGSEQVVRETLPLMASAPDDYQDLAPETLLDRNRGYANAARATQAARPNKTQFTYLFALRHAATGWTPDLRRTYFTWFPRARSWKGGNSFAGFVENARQEGLANIATDQDRDALAALSESPAGDATAGFEPPQGPGRNYTVDGILALSEDGAALRSGRDFERGKNLFGATACLACHRFRGEGGTVGPDITGAGSRYTLYDLAENIVSPSTVISDQYGSNAITLADGSSVVGRLTVEENGKLFVLTNPFAPSQLTAIDADDVEAIEPYPHSMMPPGLVNSLNPEELLDLLAYILAGGNQDDPAFEAGG